MILKLQKIKKNTLLRQFDVVKLKNSTDVIGHENNDELIICYQLFLDRLDPNYSNFHLFILHKFFSYI